MKKTTRKLKTKLQETWRKNKGNSLLGNFIKEKFICFIFLKTEIATGLTVEAVTCTQDTMYLCCNIDLVNTNNNPCNKVTSCANPKDSNTRTCDPTKQNGDYICQVKIKLLNYVCSDQDFFFFWPLKRKSVKWQHSIWLKL